MFLPALAEHPDIEVARVVLVQPAPRPRRKQLRLKWRKISRIGPLGVLTGLYLRSWNAELDVEDVEIVAGRYGIPVDISPKYNGKRTRELVGDSGADLGLTLGTALIRRSVFGIPRHGLINVHGDVLPRFRGGHSVIWPIYEGVSETGFSVHQIDSGIDTGLLLHVEKFPIDLRPTLRETYLANTAEIRRRVPAVLADVVANYERYRDAAETQGAGTTYTTPTLWQFLRMVRRHRAMLREARGGGS